MKRKLYKQIMSKLPISKPMRWGSQSVSFIRPVHWIVMLYGDVAFSLTLLATGGLFTALTADETIIAQNKTAIKTNFSPSPICQFFGFCNHPFSL